MKNSGGNIGEQRLRAKFKSISDVVQTIFFAQVSKLFN